MSVVTNPEGGPCRLNVAMCLDGNQYRDEIPISKHHFSVAHLLSILLTVPLRVRGLNRRRALVRQRRTCGSLKASSADCIRGYHILFVHNSAKIGCAAVVRRSLCDRAPRLFSQALRSF